MPQSGEELDPREATLREHQRTDHASQRVAAVEDRQMKPADTLGLFAKQVDRQFAFGAEGLRASALGARTFRQLRLAEIEPTRDGKEPRGLIRVGEERAEDDPIMGSDGGGAVGTACRVFVEGAGAPNMGFAAMDFGVVERPNMVAVPQTVGRLLDESRQPGGDVSGVPGAVLGEGFQSFPVSGPIEGEHRLSDGVLFDVERQGREPLGEAREAAFVEGPLEGAEEIFPDRPDESSVGHLSSPVRMPAAVCHHLAESVQETMFFNKDRLIS
jgi:hypothetical protein